MSPDLLAQYRGNEDDTFKAETPTVLLNEYIPQPVVMYYSSHKVNTLGDLYPALRDAWESLQTKGTNRNVGELTLEDLALEETEFNELVVKITKLLEVKYLKTELVRRYNPPKIRGKKDNTPWYLQE